MISFDQVQLLEKKVSDAVQLIKTLKKENRDLTEEVTFLKEQIAELESQKSSMTSEQEQIAKGIIEALHQFDKLNEENREAVTEESADADLSETVSASEETEIAQPEVEMEPTDDAEANFELSLEAEIPAMDEVVAESDESGNHSELLEGESEDPQDEAPAEPVAAQAAVESSFEDAAAEESVKAPLSSEIEVNKNAGYPQNLEIF